MMNITDRHQYILEKLKKDGKVNIFELTEEMGVSGVTIRKDLKLLEDKKLMFKIRGGGSLNNPYAGDKPIYEKELINAEEKKRIAKAAIDLIGDTDSIMIGSGTTVFEVARALFPAKHLTVITPALRVGLELSHRPNVEVLQLGGLIRPNSSSVMGASAMQMLSDISCGIYFCGVDGIDLNFGISISNISEAALNQKMIESAQTVAVLADSTKFDRRGLGRICSFEAVHYIITDRNVSASTVKALEERDIKVIVV
ncbi:MAG TPA: DeoR/GlpR family DNA-binding transcription regulator [Dinghuibacter sp.]|uniref:DeoR/GlpR family DNA-binding transcription regulator n=1 Tax=Dinghuibacter sp. TaxID=2024697 RepID=UPI002B532580|nr:DeoR/GlpR family DNA-binding transcription regulator [Dinghuibacter sp.]HTJ12373.1 DeoR/GlpR family DNA-binding transcription regulator [Dinghuibacter sp.]